jgi:hypothetical protein
MRKQSESAESMRAKADAAFRQAAVKVIERAKQTGTPVIVWKDGRVAAISPEEAEQGLARQSADVNG